MTPTARSLELLREMGYTVDVVERRIPRTHITRDLFGCIDILAIHPEHGFLGVQATGDNGGHVANRCAKAAQEPRLAVWLRAGGRFEVWGWGKRGPAKRRLWTLRRKRARLADDAVAIEDIKGGSHGTLDTDSTGQGSG